MITRLPWRKIGRWTLEASPVLLAMYAASMSLHETPWLLEASLYDSALMLGLTAGFLLAISRFRVRTAWIYGLAFSIFFALQLSSRFVPSMDTFFSNGSEAPLLLMHSRLLAFTGLFIDGIRASIPGELFRLQQVRQFCLLFVVFGTSIWFAWWTFRTQRVLIGALPLGLLMAITIERFELTVEFFQLFLLFTVLTFALTHFKTLHRRWETENIDHPDGLGLEWGTSAVLISIAAILLAGIAPLVATPEGWDTIRDWFETREPVRQASLQTDDGSSVSPPSISSDHTPQLSEIGLPPSTGLETVMWVEISDPAPPPESIDAPSAVRQHYWRSHIFTDYNGRGWKSMDEPIEYSANAQVRQISTGRYPLEQTFRLANPDTDPLFGVNNPIALISGDRRFYIPQEGVLHPFPAKKSVYSILSQAAAPSAADLALAGDSYPSDIINTYLQLPPGIPARVTSLAEELTRGLDTPYEKALRIETYLRLNYPYNLNIPPPDDGRDITEFFLFESEGGFCSHFATAMVVMLRSVGIPSRVVSGFTMGTFEYDLGAYRVRARDAHAWVEVYFPGIGFVEFEPTPSRNTFQRSEETSRGLMDGIEDEISGWAPGSVILPVLLVAILLGLLLTGIVFGVRLNFEFRNTDPMYGRIGEIYLTMRHLLAGVGFQGTTSTTPYEFLAQFSGQVADQEVILHTLQEATDRYSRLRYSESEPTLQEDCSMDQMWRESKRAWIQFILKNKFSAAAGSIRSRLDKL